MSRKYEGNTFFQLKSNKVIFLKTDVQTNAGQFSLTLCNIGVLYSESPSIYSEIKHKIRCATCVSIIYNSNDPTQNWIAMLYKNDMFGNPDNEK